MTSKSILSGLGIVALLGATSGLTPLYDRVLGFDGGAHAQPPAAAEAAAAPGLVEPVSDERDLAAISAGPIVYIGADEGDKVTAGEVIAEIDNADLKAQLAAARARLTIRENELARLENGARDEERRAAQAALDEADAALRLARSTLQRRSSLAKDGIASDQAVDQARADLDAATARRALKADQVALITAPPRTEDVAIATANLALAQAEIATLVAQIEKTILRSPIDGVLLRRYKALGETVSDQPPTPIAKIGDISHLRVKAQVDEADVARITLGQRAYVTADAYGDRRFAGRITKIGVRLGRKEVWTDAATDKRDTQTLPVTIDLDEAVHLPVGLRVDVMFEPTTDTPNDVTAPAG